MQVEVQGTIIALQRMPLTGVTLDAYILGSQLYDDGADLSSSERFMRAAFAETRASGCAVQQGKALICHQS